MKTSTIQKLERALAILNLNSFVPLILGIELFGVYKLV